MSRRWRWVGLAALLGAAALGGLGWQHRQADGALADRSADAGRADSVARRVAAAVPVASVAVPASATVEAATSTPPGAAINEPDIPPEGMELCGVRRVSADELRRWKADPTMAKAQMKAIDDQALRKGQAAVARLAARLAAGNERQQAAARLMMDDRDGAAWLAERSTDPWVYQAALSACRGRSDSAPHCARLNPQRWAELDPSDARPWLRVMEDARQHGDTAAMDAALAEAVARPRLSRSSFLLEAEAVAVAGAVPDVAELGHALVLIIGMDAAMMGFDLGAPGRACRGDGLRDATRLAQCRALSRQVLANATDLTDAMVAQRMADRTGVPREQQAHDAATLKAAMERYTMRAMESVDMDCAAMRRLKQFSTERAASGELAMALGLLPAH